MNEDKENGKENGSTVTPMQILEEALELCKFGRFNFKLMFATLLAVFSYTSVTTTSSYILPSAECDLNMSIMQKGLLNAMPFVGQVGAALFTGFITDAFGRKIFLVWGHVGMFLCNIIEGTSQTYWMLLFGKLLDGIFISFTFSATAVMVTEFTHKGVRDRVLMVYSSFMSFSLVLCALVAWGLLPRPWDFIISEGYFEFHSWNIYLYVSSISSLAAALMYWHLPESPKFLLTLGRETEALDVIKRIYHENSGQPKDSFHDYMDHHMHTHVAAHAEGGRGRRCQEHSLRYSSLRLWFPQLSTIVENFQSKHGGETSEFCIMIDGYTSELARNVSLAAENSVADICVPHPSGQDTYINGIILGVFSGVLIGISSSLVDILGQKPLMTLALSFNIMIGRIGSLVGSVLFPVMLQGGCMVPFISLSIITLCVAALVYFLPNPSKQNSGTGDK
ncbi:hypothetical protein MSG28_011802 [Choristoneura fumiferana]|uniref:Uncharacterized protein n=1 Tax=Choristoneura fumiferana TaxID=7141 RepID=A0ACC0KMD6_CHOFU|nr:hypothetical protein MSG28_011802 [Choristoneura fumiferana]